jgi:maltose O-acetyltransferase
MAATRKNQSSQANPWLWYRDLPPKGWQSYVPVFFSWLFAFEFFRNLYVTLALPNCSKVYLAPGFRVYYADRLFGHRIFLGDTVFQNYAPVTIGEGTTFSGNNKVLTGSHGVHDRNWVQARPVTIGTNVWISTDCLILGGVTIGDNCMIGAGSVVSRDIPANCFAAGNPCRVIKRFKKGDFVQFLYPGEPTPPKEQWGSVA